MVNDSSSVLACPVNDGEQAAKLPVCIFKAPDLKILTALKMLFYIYINRYRKWNIRLKIT